MSHPLLTKVLHAAMSCGCEPSIGKPVRWECDYDADHLYADDVPDRIPPDIADRLERALDVCAKCGWVRIEEDPDWHDRDWNATPFAEHPYKPLVAP